MPERIFKHGVPPQRIRTYLALFALALAVPVVGLAVFAFNRMAGLEQAEIERRVMQVAEGLSDDIDRELDRAVAILETLATSDTLRSGDLRAFHSQALQVLRNTKSAIVLIDQTYHQLVDTLTEYGAELPKTADIDTARKVFDTGRRQVSDVFRGSISGRFVFNVEVPVLQEARVRYLLIMSFQAAHVADILKSARLGSPWITGVTDNKGIILARSERHDDFVGKPLPTELLQQSRAAKGVFRATSVAGREILRATVRSQIAGWLVSATVPVSYLEAPSQRGQFFGIVILGTALALGAILAFVFGSFMARPLDAAMAAADDLESGVEVRPLLSPLVEANTLVSRLRGASVELNQRREHVEFLMRELAHRAKNQLAVVRGMALQTANQSTSINEFVKHFNERIQGLAESQDLMLRQNWQGAWLGDLVYAQLELFGVAKRATVDGPAIFLSANAVQNIGFALHELATNASKHGALSSPNGAVDVSWGPESDGRVRLRWVESGGPIATPPERKGFGHLVITQLVAQALQGSSELEFARGGVRWSLDIPSTHIVNVAAVTN